jgi:hypothetical protein
MGIKVYVVEFGGVQVTALGGKKTLQLKDLAKLEIVEKEIVFTNFLDEGLRSYRTVDGSDIQGSIFCSKQEAVSFILTLLEPHESHLAEQGTLIEQVRGKIQVLGSGEVQD